MRYVGVERLKRLFWINIKLKGRSEAKYFKYVSYSKSRTNTVTNHIHMKRIQQSQDKVKLHLKNHDVKYAHI